ncbi:hypothetical protein ROS62_04920 [Streptomyces sp. DSM 41972]|uniref:Uncharacterized protein n=1 Tax=Streptomyces althioticus subsp. attaecolombicae TaxID=3075534 RepID=A0ABU3HUA9_9ACTN|nr:hypothetical protein [Streptomyces sp. DSM 41972]SCD74960.1 hypothetical protein GA0115238_122825 [Streptomyces sp. di50b]SCD85225.1 hypothetical protein GA0115245_114725 [Streptomyces sp. di188]
MTVGGFVVFSARLRGARQPRCAPSSRQASGGRPVVVKGSASNQCEVVNGGGKFLHSRQKRIHDAFETVLCRFMPVFVVFVYAQKDVFLMCGDSHLMDYI